LKKNETEYYISRKYTRKLTSRTTKNWWVLHKIKLS